MAPLTATRSKPISPTSSLPPLARLSTYSLPQIKAALNNLRALYFPSTVSSTPLIPLRRLPKHLIHDKSVPDSGYASAEEDEDEMTNFKPSAEEDEEDEVAILRADTFERDFAMRWLIGFAARSDVWVCCPDVTTETEETAREQVVDEAASILALFAGDEEEEAALTREFSFPFPSANKIVDVELNDAPLLSDDHTSVGLQSWASSIHLSERFCADPNAFGFLVDSHPCQRVLELGAGTGLLSITLAQLYVCANTTLPEIVATDFHPSVLANLEVNVTHNFPSSSDRPIQVLPLDWEKPVYESPFDREFDMIIAADVVYHHDHARWIKSCVEKLLKRSSGDELGGVFWMIIAVRSTGRHEGLSNNVDAVFASSGTVSENPGQLQLAILQKDFIGKMGGLGRADESSYILYKIGWV
ncbi:hypothetical protein QCA50_002430 [Cerrena zonata]|uniref:Uncharacterized protein n=1 Tax=Cerrena zonata TaxID=2478898 RepID=A0AAW0GVD2_9APHY